MDEANLSEGELSLEHLFEELYLRIGEHIQRIRKSKKLSAEALGNRIGVTKKTIRRYELGEIKISVERIKQIADVLDIEVSSLYPQPENTLHIEQLVELELMYKGKPLSRDKKLQIVDMLARILDFSQ